MRSMFAALAGAILIVVPAFAGNTEGVITQFDATEMTVVLDDGSTYRLPPEMDVSAISEGVEILVAYDEGDDGTRQITDMEILQ